MLLTSHHILAIVGSVAYYHPVFPSLWVILLLSVPRYTSTKEGCDKNLEALAEGGITELDMILLLGSCGVGTPMAPRGRTADRQVRLVHVAHHGLMKLGWKMVRCPMSPNVWWSNQRKRTMMDYSKPL